MGHLISILNKVVDSCNKTGLGQFLKDKLPDVSEKLNAFKETTLSETNKTQETLLVSSFKRRLIFFSCVSQF